MISRGLVSPLVLMTPRTQQLYAFGESSTSKLAMVNESIFDRAGRKL